MSNSIIIFMITSELEHLHQKNVEDEIYKLVVFISKKYM